jgi:hypothetical protein
MSRCYTECECSCGNTPETFDKISASELVLHISLKDLTHSNIGWFSDKSIGDHLINEWNLEQKEGIYIIWHKNDYCAKHEMYHMRALYVGKGIIGTRLRSHWKNKDFSEELILYFTFFEMKNRVSKYIEQLLLDIFDFPFNKVENTGKEKLCVHFTQSEVD